MIPTGLILKALKAYMKDLFVLFGDQKALL
jgi:hypothetical protein